jgi:hypothetical protein
MQDASDAMRRGVAGLEDDLRRQLRLLARRAASYRRITTALIQLLGDAAKSEALRAQLDRTWANRSFDAFYERPLLLYAALRWNALDDGVAHPLHAALRDDDPDPDSITDAGVLDALDPARTGLWTTLGSRRVQTNETSRALAWMWPAALGRCSDGMRPLVLVDVGCSAGLNLVADALPAVWTNTAGLALPVASRPKIVSRWGLDARPLDPTHDGDARWLHACFWPGERARLERFQAAVAAFRLARSRGERLEIVRRDVLATPDVIKSATTGTPDDTLTIVYSTMVTGYLDPPTRDEFGRTMDRLVCTAPAGSLLWADLDLTGPTASARPAELRVHARAGDTRATWSLGMMGYHPSEVAVREEAVRDLSAHLRSGKA